MLQEHKEEATILVEIAHLANQEMVVSFAKQELKKQLKIQFINNNAILVNNVIVQDNKEKIAEVIQQEIVVLAKQELKKM